MRCAVCGHQIKPAVESSAVAGGEWVVWVCEVEDCPCGSRVCDGEGGEG